ncbi:MAG TPA: glycosyltransferase family 2 protein [Thermoanaerobaculia bacterium]|nr:glycosyltransferase family 2 protein [Thermoanaerobaculia bacterium]
MILAAQIVFWTCLAVCVYIYFGYPALLWGVSKLRPRPVAVGDFTPLVTFVIAAFNEEKVIAEKIENSLSLDYPADRIEVLVVSNGSTDRTDEIVRGFTDPRVRLLALPQPGKMQALNEGAAAARGEILVFTDADFLLDNHTLRLMMSRFADAEVGGVCGSRNTNVARGGDATGEGEGLYARWDKWQKTLESRIGSVFAADGLLYAIRKELYSPITDLHAADDIWISTAIPLQGYRLVYEPKATAFERAGVQAEQEFGRRIRVTNHSVRALLVLRSHLFRHGFYSLELLSHKLVRHMIPFFLIPLFFASALLALHGWFYALALAGQAAVYGLALVGWVLRNRRIGRAKPFFVPYYFCFVNVTAFLGILSIARRRNITAWGPRGGALPAAESRDPAASSTR